jgi:hypothetical protein
METLTRTSRSVGGAGLRPAGAAAGCNKDAAMKEGLRGGTMGSPMFEKPGRYQSSDYFTLD